MSWTLRLFDVHSNRRKITESGDLLGEKGVKDETSLRAARTKALSRFPTRPLRPFPQTKTSHCTSPPPLFYPSLLQRRKEDGRKARRVRRGGGSRARSSGVRPQSPAETTAARSDGPYASSGREAPRRDPTISRPRTLQTSRSPRHVDPDDGPTSVRAGIQGGSPAPRPSGVPVSAGAVVPRDSRLSEARARRICVCAHMCV